MTTRGAYGVLVGIPERKRSLERLTCRRRDNSIKLYIQVIGLGLWTGLDWSGSGCRQEAGSCELSSEPLGAI